GPRPRSTSACTPRSPARSRKGATWPVSRRVVDLLRQRIHQIAGGRDDQDDADAPADRPTAEVGGRPAAGERRRPAAGRRGGRRAGVGTSRRGAGGATRTVLRTEPGGRPGGSPLLVVMRPP